MKTSLTLSFVSVLMGSLLVAASTILAQRIPPQPPTGEFQLQPASPELPDVTAQQRDAEQALEGIDRGRLTSQQLGQMLLNHTNPNIRAKAQQAAKGVPGPLRPASPELPDVAAQQRDAEQALEGIDRGRLTSQQLRQMLLDHPNLRIREKAREAQRVKQQSQGSLNSPDPVASLSALWGLLNPFAAGEAQAQSGYSVRLRPLARYSDNPFAYLNLYGANAVGSTRSVFTTYVLANSSIAGTGTTISKPYAYVRVSIPRTGWYLVDFYGYGKPRAVLRQQTVGYPVLESWDMNSSPTPYNHFATAEYLAQGTHSFSFTVDTSVLYFYEVAIEAF